MYFSKAIREIRNVHRGPWVVGDDFLLIVCAGSLSFALLSAKSCVIQAVALFPQTPQFIRFRTSDIPPRRLGKKAKRLQNLSVHWLVDDIDAPPSLSASEIDCVNRLFQANSRLIVSASDPSDLPAWNIPEVAFAGRSNCGKSSLINAILGQPGLVRTSKTPGRTQLLNFFSVGGKKGSLPAMSVVDMPGYGFAKPPKDVVDTWDKLVGGYIERRQAGLLKNLFVLLDARRGITTLDQEFLDFLEEMESLYQIIFTKIDAVPTAELEKNIREVLNMKELFSRRGMNPIVLATSTKESFGIRQMQQQAVYMTGLLTNCTR
uniref:Uncharacterized protein AlNc14C3G528 n=1 Tax=Albugo laibachii Nc14 TaxID=890382 RepID=F0W086_9STRA|nr:conserved hypothetical protein [Albugo laibachii Nc14]|eukprot:CCA14457.1 conserved hypothetical protein [Albugo laibachii Nc14]